MGAWIFFVVFMTVLIVPQLTVAYILKGKRQGLSIIEWVRS